MGELERAADRIESRAKDYENDAVIRGQSADLATRLEGIAFQIASNVLIEVARALRDLDD